MRRSHEDPHEPERHLPSLAGAPGPLAVLRLVVAVVFGASGYFHLRDPVGRAKSIELSPTATLGLGAAEALASIGLVTGILIQPAALGLILLGLGAIQKKAFKWKTGFWGEKAGGWHYDLMLLAMNLVIVATAGGRWVLGSG
ncbi:MAG TPA: DoxX family membrane protein [Myxococcaceae bacterium]|nr:DoxX family membrane protein [Myxococcaceae bacterium]